MATATRPRGISAMPTPWPPLHARYPDDVDATAFDALALLGTSHEGRDEATYMKSAALLEEVYPTPPPPSRRAALHDPFL